MVANQVQKTGRVIGDNPKADARVIDQFMDDVIARESGNTTIINEITQIINILSSTSRICRRIAVGISIPNEKVELTRDPIINDGVTVTIEDGGEFYVL